MSDAQREAKLYRAARRQRLALRKCRLRTLEDPRYGTYMLIDPYTNTIHAGDTNSGYGLSLDEVEELLAER